MISTTWQHLAGLPSPNAWLLVGTLVTGIIMAWAALGAARTSLARYPPRRGYTDDQRSRSRKAWSTAAVLGTMAIWSLYRIDVLWWLETPVSDRALAVEVLRALAAVWLAWAWRPTRHEVE